MIQGLPVEFSRHLSGKRGPGLLITRNNLALLAALRTLFPETDWQVLTKEDMRGRGLRRLFASLWKRPWRVVIVEDRWAEVVRREDLYVLLLLLARTRSRWVFATKGSDVEARSVPFMRGWGRTLAALVVEGWSSVRAILYGYRLIWTWQDAAPPPDRSPSPGRRIAMLRPQFWFDVQAGGSVSHIRGVASGMRDLGLLPHLWTTSKMPGSDLELPQTEVPPDPRPRLFEDAAMVGFNRLLLGKVRRELEAFQPALVYQRHDVFSLAGLALARLLRVPLVLEVNASEVWAREAWSRLFLKDLARKMERAAFRNADRLVLISEELVPTVLALGGNQDRIVVNPNGVDVRRFDPNLSPTSAKLELGFAPDVILCGFLGTFARWHGVLFLAEQIPALLRDEPRLRFVMIGEGDMKPEVESRLREAGVGEQVAFPGLVAPDAVPGYLAACDILLSPHLPFEDGTAFFGSPTKLFEYMAAGRPIVASRLGSIGRVLCQDETGKLIDPGDGPAFRAAILELANAPETRRRLGRNARSTVLSHYTWTANARRALLGLVELPRIESP